MGSDDGSSQTVRLKEWDLQSLEGLGCSLKEFDSQITHLGTGKIRAPILHSTLVKTNRLGKLSFQFRLREEKND